MNNKEYKECLKSNDCSECMYGYTLNGKYWKCGSGKTQKEVIAEIMEYNKDK